MLKKNNRILTIINIILPVLIAAGGAVLFLQNYLYTGTERVHRFSEAPDGVSKFVFDDITIEITKRGGDSGSWLSNEMSDENGNVLYANAVGTIYEMIVTNNSPDTVVEWNASLYIPEFMYINNTWNGDFEIHQNVKNGDEKVQTLDLANYSRYDIILDCSMCSVGPLLPLNEGDYFVYYPESDLYEVPIPPKREISEKDGGITVGFILYLPEKEMNYTADFSEGEIRYHLKANIFNNPLFWVLGAMTIIWISCFLALIIVKVNLRRLIEQRERDEKTIEQTMRTIVNFIETKDPSTMGHSLRVARYSRMIAEKMNFTEYDCKRIYYIALMHDCGKIYIPDEILCKPGKLTQEEFEIMKKHTVYGGEILRDFTSIEGIAMGALSHHERYDGKGYPHGLAGENIPLVARIICVSDSFDAMNSRRCYRSSLPTEVIFNELLSNKGTQFDPKVIDCLLSIIEDGAITVTGNENENIPV